MIPSCFKENCANVSSFYCECESKIQFCKNHMSEHLISDKPHKLDLILLALEDQKKTELSEKIESLIELNNEFLSCLQNFVKNAADLIIQTTSKSINQLLKVNMYLNRVSIGLKTSNSVLAHDLNSIEKASMIEIDYFEEFLQETTQDFIDSLENFIVTLTPDSDLEDNGLDIIQELSYLRCSTATRSRERRPRRSRGGRGTRGSRRGRFATGE